MALYSHRKTIDTPQAVPTWLIRTAHRKALTIHRNRARRAELNALVEKPLPVTIPDQEIIALQDAANIRLAFGQLDPRCRQVLGRLFLTSKDESYESIARGLKIKLNSLGPLRSRCLEQLKRNLTKLGVDTD